jgi:hypothetical protein
MTMPNFLVIGAAKAGTSSIYEYLRQHPQVFMSPEKETNFFAFGEPVGQAGPFRGEPEDAPLNYSTSALTLEAYQAQFAKARGEPAVGEASPVYLSHPRAPAQIQKYLPRARLIAVLRNPIDRAFSAYMMRVRDGLERPDGFAEAIRGESRRTGGDWSARDYLNKGLYCEQLRRYFDRFDRRQMRVYLFDDLARDPLAIMRDLFQFLDVDARFTPATTVKHNASGVIRSPVARFLWTRSRGLRDLFRPLLPPRARRAAFQFVTRDLVKSTLSPELRSELFELYRADIDRLEALLERDLSVWRQPPAERLAA